MLKRQWSIIALSGVFGLILGFTLVLQLHNDSSYSICDKIALLLFSPVYGVGLIYSLSTMFRLTGSLLKWFGTILFMRGISSGGCGFGGCADWLFRILVIILLFGLIVGFIWIIGVFSAAKKLRDAEIQDNQIAGVLTM